jgi:ring-1,2-phenylacetyl-CoA epoxidase subunit PaaE
MEPMGNFILNDTIPVAEHQIYLWGAGSGITPLMAIAKYALNYKKAASVTRAYGNRYFDDIIFKDDIEALQTQFSGVFSARHFITHPFLGEDNPYILQGRIAAKDVSRILSEQPAYVNNSVHYVCRRFINF